MNKILSISIAAYNIEKYIKTTVGSLLHDDILDKLEILIISDGSTDKTVQLGREFERDFPNTVKVIEKENGGWGSTVNTSIQNATGKYFKLLDGDDQVITENMPQFIQYLEANDFDLVLTPYIEFIDETGVLKEKITNGEFAEGGITASNLPENVKLDMHECCFKTELLKKNQIHITEKCFYTDIEFVIKGLSVTETIGFLDKTIYKYRVASSEQSMSVNGFRKHYKEHLKMLYSMLEFEKSYLGNGNIKNAIQSRLKLVVMMQYNIFFLLKPDACKKKEVILFDKNLKQKYKKYYNVPMKKVVLLRKSNFWLYPYLCKVYLKKEGRKND